MKSIRLIGAEHPESATMLAVAEHLASSGKRG
jgi:hypothetical protein